MLCVLFFLLFFFFCVDRLRVCVLSLCSPVAWNKLQTEGVAMDFGTFYGVRIALYACNKPLLFNKGL